MLAKFGPRPLPLLLLLDADPLLSPPGSLGIKCYEARRPTGPCASATLFVILLFRAVGVTS